MTELVFNALSHKDKPKHAIGSLPLDVLVEVLSWLDPIDLLHLQQCNKSFRKACSLRTIWLNAYRAQIQEHCLLENPSLQGMSIMELKQTVTNPVSFIRVLQKANKEQPVIRAERTSILSHPAGMEFISTAMVPGGRFLFTFTEHTIQLWDLGMSIRSLMPSRPLSEFELGKDVLDNMKQPLVMKENNDLFILLATSCFDEDARPYDSKIHFITCSYETGEFTSKVVLNLSNSDYYTMNWEGACLTGVLLVLPLISDIIVWSFWDHKSITLQGEIGSLENQHSFSHTVITCADEALINDYIISTGGGTIRVYKLPELENADKNLKVPAPPALCVSTSPHHFSRTIAPSAWNEHISPPDGRGVIAFDCIAQNHTQDKTTICRYTIRDIPNIPIPVQEAPQIDNPIPSIYPERKDEIVLGTASCMDLDGPLVSCDLDDKLRALFWVGDDNFLRFQLVGLNKEGRWIKQKGGILYEWYRAADPVFSLCPISGRVCAVTREGEIRIMDFVPLIP